MQKVANDKMFDYYEYTVKLGDSRVEYYFEVHSGHMVCYFNSVGVCSSVENYYNFSITPSFQTPDWAKGAIIYQIFVDRFTMEIAVTTWRRTNIFTSERERTKILIG